MKTRKLKAWWFVLIVVSIDGCQEQSAPPSEGTAHGALRPVHVKAAATTFRPRKTVIGHVVLRRQLALRAAHAGRVVDCPWLVGQKVERGQIFLRLAGPRIDGPRSILRNDLEAARRQEGKARADVDRLEKELAAGLITDQDKNLSAARATLAEDRFAVAKAEAELAQLESFSQVIVPIEAQISELPGVRDTLGGVEVR